MTKVFDPFCLRARPQEVDENEAPVQWATMLGGKLYHSNNGTVIFQREVEGIKKPQTLKFDNMEHAEAGLRRAVQDGFDRSDFQNRVYHQVERGTIDQPEFTTIAEEHPDATIRAYGARVGVTADLQDPVRPVAKVMRWLGMEPRLDPDIYRTVEGNASKFGELGHQATSMLNNNRDMQNRLEAKANLVMDQALKLIGDDEARRIGFNRFVEFGEGPANPEQAAQWTEAYKVLMDFKNELYDNAKSLGIEVKDKLENYFPHVYDWERWINPEVEEQAINQLIRRGVVSTRAEANDWIEKSGYGWSRDRVVQHVMTDKSLQKQEAIRQLFDKDSMSMMSLSLDRRSGHLESDRIGLPGYVTNTEIAWRTAFLRDIRRISEVTNFGLHDEHMQGVIADLGENVGKRAASYIENAFAIEVGKNRLDFAKLGTVMRGLYNWQAAKLSLSLLANLAQPLNAGIRGGFFNMAKALGEVPGMIARQGEEGTLAYLETRGEKAARYFRQENLSRSARVLNGILDDVQENGLSRLADQVPSTFMKGVNFTQNGLSWLFNVSELFVNRYVSSRVGEMFFEQEAQAFAQGGKRGALAAMRLKEMGFDGAKVAEAMQNDPEAFKEMGISAAQVFTRQTQFKGDTLSLPLWASKGGEGGAGELARLMLQFKTFPINQGRFILREMTAFQRGDTARSVRAFAALTTAFPVLGYALAKTRSQIIGNTVTTDMLDRELRNPTVFNLAMAGLTASAMLGSVGIMGDVIGSSWSGNKFSAMGMFVPPTIDSMLNLGDAARSTVQGIAYGDKNLLRHGAKNVLREGGGIGSAVAHKVFGLDQ